MGWSKVQVLSAGSQSLPSARPPADAIAGLCPLSSARLKVNDFLACVEACEVFSGKTVLLPAELVFFPSPRPSHERVFSSSANGLSSGSSTIEASVHGLLEVIERDAVSFHYVKDQTQPIRLATLPN